MKNVYEIFDEFEKASTKEEKIAALQRNDNNALRAVLRGTFHPDIKFVIDRVPEYRPADIPPGMSYSSIAQEMSRVYLFEQDNPRVAANLSQERKVHILTQILEMLEKREAEVFMNMLLKKQVVKGLNASIVKEAFPGLI